MERKSLMELLFVAAVFGMVVLFSVAFGGFIAVLLMLTLLSKGWEKLTLNDLKGIASGLEAYIKEREDALSDVFKGFN